MVRNAWHSVVVVKIISNHVTQKSEKFEKLGKPQPDDFKRIHSAKPRPTLQISMRRMFKASER